MGVWNKSWLRALAAQVLAVLAALQTPAQQLTQHTASAKMLGPWGRVRASGSWP